MKLRAVIFLTLLVLSLPMLAQLVGRSSQAQPTRALSTPELIDAAYARGEIDADTRHLYHAYAIYRFESLPEAYRGSVSWSGTPYVAQINGALAGTGPNEVAPASASALAEIRTLVDPDGAGSPCDQALQPNDTNTTNFHVNYNQAQLQNYTLNEYTTHMEQMYTALTAANQYGFNRPPLCNDTDNDGTCNQMTNPWNLYPVQIVANLDPSLLGYVSSGSRYAAFVGDNPNSTAVEQSALASCMVLRSDYDKTTQDLEQTFGHEYFHAIQFGYGSKDGTDAMWDESTAAYMEDELIDGLNSQYQYLFPEPTICLGETPAGQQAQHEYAKAFFFRFAAERNGGANSAAAGSGIDILREYLRRMSLDANKDALTAYNEALTTKGTNLNDTFHSYAIANRFLKSCGAAAPNCFEEADEYRAWANNNGVPLPSDHGNVAGIGSQYDGNLADHYAINWVGLPNTGTYRVRFANTTAGGEFRVSVVADMGNTLMIQPIPDTISGSESKTLDYTVPNGAQSVVAVITNQKMTSPDPAACVNNPYRISLEQVAGQATATPTVPASTATPTPQPGVTPTPAFRLHMPNVIARR